MGEVCQAEESGLPAGRPAGGDRKDPVCRETRGDAAIPPGASLLAHRPLLGKKGPQQVAAFRGQYTG